MFQFRDSAGWENYREKETNELLALCFDAKFFENHHGCSECIGPARVVIERLPLYVIECLRISDMHPVAQFLMREAIRESFSL